MKFSSSFLKLACKKAFLLASTAALKLSKSSLAMISSKFMRPWLWTLKILSTLFVLWMIKNGSFAEAIAITFGDKKT